MARKPSRRRRTQRDVEAQRAQQAPEMPPQVDLADEYRYVIEDLTRIGVIAAILIGQPSPYL